MVWIHQKIMKTKKLLLSDLTFVKDKTDEQKKAVQKESDMVRAYYNNNKLQIDAELKSHNETISEENRKNEIVKKEQKPRKTRLHHVSRILTK
eukprot:UN02790